MTSVSVNDLRTEKVRGHAVVTEGRQDSGHFGPEKATGARVTRGGFAPVSRNTIGGHQLSPLHDSVERTLQAETDQAKLFDGMLRTEIARLQQAVRFIEIRRIRRAPGRIGDSTPPADELLELRARIAELHRQRSALWRRFLLRSDDSGDALKA